MLRTVPAGETIRVMEQTNEWWWKVEYKGTEGYIAASFISISYSKTIWNVLQTYPLVSGMVGLSLIMIIALLRKSKKNKKPTQSKTKRKRKKT